MLQNDSSLFKVDIGNYNGPLDVLLDLAKTQKVNLEDISITKLADQFHDFITKEKDLNKKIHFNQWVNEASWSSEDAQWTVQAENKKTQELQDFTCDFLFLCGGYYNYEEGYTPHFAGSENFLGQINHPQKWPKNLDYKNHFLTNY